MTYMVIRNRHGKQIARVNWTVVSIVWTIAFLTFAVSRMVGQNVRFLPAPKGTLVNDYANVLTPDQRKTLEVELRTYEKATGCEIALVTTPNLEGWGSVEEYASALFKQWGIGKKGVDNGVLIVNAIVERKYRIEVGYGLEGLVTDFEAGRIIKNDAIPLLKGKDYYGAYSATIASLKAKIGTMTAEERALWKEQQAKEAQKRQAEMNEGLLTFGFWVLILGVVGGGAWAIWWIATAKKREERRKREEEEKRRQEAEMFKAMEKSLVSLGALSVAAGRTHTHATPTNKSKRKKSDDSSGLITGAILGSTLSHDDDSSRRSSSDSDSGSSFGGGSSGGGGATGDY